MDRNEIMKNLTAEQRAAVEKIEKILTDEKNQEKIKNITDINEIIAFFEENGVAYSDEQKEEIKKATAEISAAAADGELTEEELEAAAGGWSWSNFFGGASGGAIVGGLIGAIAAVSNPVGWAIAAGAGIGALIGGGTLGPIIGALD